MGDERESELFSILCTEYLCVFDPGKTQELQMLLKMREAGRIQDCVTTPVLCPYGASTACILLGRVSAPTRQKCHGISHPLNKDH